MRAATLFVILTLLTGVGAVMAQEQALPDNPEALVVKSMDAVTAGDWEALVMMMHPDALSGLKDFLNQMFDMALEEAAQDTTESDPFAELPPELKAMAERRQEIPPDSLLLGLANFITQNVPMVTQMFQDLHADPVGTVYEGDTLAHVVCRFSMSMMGVPTPSQVTVFSAKQSPDGWRMTLPTEVEEYGQMIKAFMEMSKSGQMPFGEQ